MTKRIFTVLTIDGGGVRGIITARLLQEIEERTGKPVAELFDLVAGSSTGAILAGSLTAPSKEDPTKPRYSAAQMREFYFQYAAEIFPPSKFRQLKHLIPKASGFYDPAVFERVLDERLEDLTLKDSLTYVMMAGADMKKFGPAWMCNFKEQGKREDLPQKWESLKTKDAVRASASPPMIFPAKYIYTQPNKETPQAQDRHAFLDGSLFASTIPRRAHTMAKKLAPKDARIVVVSLGTGSLKPSLTPDEMNKMSVLDWVNNPRGASILNTSMEMTINDILDDLREELGDDLFRINALVDPDDPDAPKMSLTDGRKENLEKLDRAAQKMIEAKDEDIDRLCELLLARHHIEQKLEHSSEAFGALTEMLHNCKTDAELNKLYAQIVQFSSEAKDKKLFRKDCELYQLCRKLTEDHKTRLGEIYNQRHQNFISAEAPKPRKTLWQKFNIFGRKTPKPVNDDLPHPQNKPKNSKKHGK